MKFPAIKAPFLVNIVILIFSLFVSWFTLLFGLAHLLGAKNPNVPYSETIKGVIICIVLCLVGVIFLVVAVTSIKGILYKLKRKKLNINYF